MAELDNTSSEPSGTSRRRFLKAAAAAGAVGAVWAEPVIRGIPAYAQDARSITGSLPGQNIFWSGNRGNWDNMNLSAGITQSPSLGSMRCGEVEPSFMGTAFYTATGGTLSDPVSITATGHPGGSETCPPSMYPNAIEFMAGVPAIVALEPQTGCMFEMVGTWGDSGFMNPQGTATLQANGTQIAWSGQSGMSFLTFDIVCM